MEGPCALSCGLGVEESSRDVGVESVQGYIFAATKNPMKRTYAGRDSMHKVSPFIVGTLFSFIPTPI